MLFTQAERAIFGQAGKGWQAIQSNIELAGGAANFKVLSLGHHISGQITLIHNLEEGALGIQV